MASAAAAANGEMPAEEGGGLSLRPVADRLLLACCRAIKKQTGWQHRTLRAACDWATGGQLGEWCADTCIGWDCSQVGVLQASLTLLPLAPSWRLLGCPIFVP